MTPRTCKRHILVALATYNPWWGTRRSDAMAVYRIYLVHDDRRLEPDESFYCREDFEALRRLRTASREDIRAELWQGGRLIAVAGSRRARATGGGAQPAP